MGTPSRKARKAVLTDTRNIIPIPPSSLVAAKEQPDDSQILDMATQDIASLLGLKVWFRWLLNKDVIDYA